MMTDRRFELRPLAPKGLSLNLAAGVLGASCLLGTSPAAVWAAQDVAVEGRGVIGVNIECEGGDSIAECSTPPLVVYLEPDWPAAMAGVRLNDRLVAIDGFRVNSAEGLRVIGSMVSGERVKLEVERAGRRLELETIPRAGRVHYQGRVYTRRAPAPPPVWAERDSSRAEANQFIFVEPDARGSVSVRVVGPTEIDSAMVDFIRDHAPEAGANRYVVEDADLIRRLRASQGLFRIRAREAFDALNRARMTRPSGVRVRQVAPPVGPTGLIAGAQFIRLTPSMAENLRGPEQGCLVLRVIPDTPAAQIGLQEGDIVTEVAGISTATLERLHAAFEQAMQAQELTVAWQRRGALHNGVLVTDGE